MFTIKLTAAAKPYVDKLSALNDQAGAALKDRDTVKANDLYTQIYALTADYQEKVYAGFLKKDPNSPVAFYALTAYGGNDHKIDGQKLKPYFDMLPANVRASAEGIEYKKRIDAAITFDTKGAIGSHAEDFALLDTAGNPVKLSAFKGKYVLLDFWASWCTPCRADNPHLVTAYKQYHAKGFNILSVSLDVRSRRSAWLKAIDHDGLTAWTHVADLDKDQNSAAVAYGVTGIPQNFLIGPDGKIIARSLRGGDLEKQLAQLLK
jgi:thiol-disulfide isomerase/thioredoxin